ncbi:MAG TPA: DNA (cytosine-5-)-methyltransferase [Capillimicrobium sp.]|nr:DNA (cytosine-5-)-methyltransferase [Capillimicrobium sp.]
MGTIRAAEFFAGIGLMRLGLEGAGIETRWANDIEADKRDMYVANFGEHEFVLGDVRDVRGDDLPDVDVATASFPCTDLSLAGNRRGLGVTAAPRGEEGGSSMFWEFARVLAEMGSRRPPVVLLENVLGFASSHGGRDLAGAVGELNRLGYSCDLMAIDARHFVPQSRPRMFIVGLVEPRAEDAFSENADRPEWVHAFARRHRSARLHARELPPLPAGPSTLAGVVERLDRAAPEWWDQERLARFVGSLSPIQSARLDELRSSDELVWRTAYRRTRNGAAVWEIRADGIAGCLRTARGGSSKQALVEAGHGEVRVRWMTPREYARLMGADDFTLAARRNQALFGFGDAVCVPVIAWLCEHYVAPAAAASSSLALAV